PEMASGFLAVLDDGLGVALHGNDEGSDDHGKDDGTDEDAADPSASSAGCRLSGRFCGVMALHCVYLLANILTKTLSSNAAAVLMATLAIGIAETLGVSIRPFLFAVAIAASASFATPIGDQTNTYAYGAGGYRISQKQGCPQHTLLYHLGLPNSTHLGILERAISLLSRRLHNELSSLLLLPNLTESTNFEYIKLTQFQLPG
ncbi:MAG: hypothetical protein OSB19_00295, partial [Opitutaceae bacterium]|nr:hypothetical protein [Opitutaceae bacterium]